MVELTPTERSLRARLAAHELWAGVNDRSAQTATARRSFLTRFEREVDPDGILDPDERARRAEHAKKAYFTRLALKSARARRRSHRLDAEADAADAGLAENGGDAA